MLKTYQDYKEWRKYEVPKKSIKSLFFPEPSALYLKWLRRVEWTYNSSGILKPLFLYCYWRYRKVSLATEISIPKNVCDKGLFIPHFGSIVINATCKIGRNCMIQNNVNIGANGGGKKSPQIGNNVYIGPGAVIFGDIKIADGCYIGANAVVNKSFLEPNSVIVGIPAKVVKIDPVHWWTKNGLKLDEEDTFGK